VKIQELQEAICHVHFFLVSFANISKVGMAQIPIEHIPGAEIVISYPQNTFCIFADICYGL